MKHRTLRSLALKEPPLREQLPLRSNRAAVAAVAVAVLSANLGNRWPRTDIFMPAFPRESCEFIGALQSGLLSSILPLDEFVAVGRPVGVVPKVHLSGETFPQWRNISSVANDFISGKDFISLVRVERSVNLASNAYIQLLLGPATTMLFEFVKKCLNMKLNGGWISLLF